MTKTVAFTTAESYDDETLDSAFRNLFSLMGFDPDNPLKGLVEPGMHVFIKPNLVASRWRKSCERSGDIYSVITHPAIVEKVANFVDMALDGNGKITIGDNPSIDADFNELMKLTGLRRLEKKYRTPCEVIDMRPLVCENLDYYGQKEKMSKAPGDPNGSITVNLGSKSLLYEVDPTLFRGVFNERDDTVNSHSGDCQLYTYGRSLYDADVYISIPKLKTHQKVGATLNLKGLVGSITEKNQLVHWRVGYPEVGGDEYPDRQSWESAQNAKVTHRGSWPGNDTIWRMVVDLYEGLLMKPRRYLSIVDGITGGQGKGPFCPDTKESHVLVCGDDLLSTDIVCSRLMGMDPMKLKYLNHYIKSDYAYYDDIFVRSDSAETTYFFTADSRYLDFNVIESWECVKYENVERKKPYKVGYTTGVYDLFHIGHLNLLRKAKAMCDYLIVGVTTDELVSYKNKKAVIPFEERVRIIESIEFVDKAVPQITMDKIKAWDQYRFDVVFVGDDWKGTEKWDIIESEFKRRNVDVVYFPYTKGTSSTLLNSVLIKLRDGL